MAHRGRGHLGFTHRVLFHIEHRVEQNAQEMKMRWIVIDKEVVVLYADEADGKVTLGKLAVLPAGVFAKNFKNEQQ